MRGVKQECRRHSTTVNRGGSLAASLLLAASIVAGCSQTKPNTEESGTPPMAMMDIALPEDDTVEKWQMKVSVPADAEAKKALTLKVHLQNLSKDASDDPLKQLIRPADSRLLIISRDNEEFQNLALAQAPGELTANCTFPHPGQYVVCLQMHSLSNKYHTLIQPIQVGKGATGIAKRLPDADTTKTVGGLDFSLSDYPRAANEIAMPTFRITRDSRPVSDIVPFSPQDKPPQAGYAVVISDDGQTFARCVPVAAASPNGLFQSPIMFHTKVPKPGGYRIWAQFRIGDKKHTVDFSFNVPK